MFCDLRSWNNQRTIVDVEYAAERDRALPLRSAVVAPRRSECICLWSGPTSRAPSARRLLSRGWETTNLDGPSCHRCWQTRGAIGDNRFVMAHPSRRIFLRTAAAFSVAAIASRSFAQAKGQRVFVGSNKPDGIVAFDWNSETGEFKPADIAASIANVDWIIYSPDRRYLFAASEVDSFNGKPTGDVASSRGRERNAAPPLRAELGIEGHLPYRPRPHRPHASVGRLWRRKRSQLSGEHGKLSEAVWTEQYTGHGPVADRQESAHAHFASYSPDNRFAYINDLGGDCIHIYSLDAGHSAFEILPGNIPPAGLGPAHAPLPSQRYYRVFDE